MLSIVTKHFEGRNLATFVPGQIVDSTDWPKETILHAQRYLRPAPPGATGPKTRTTQVSAAGPTKRKRTASTKKTTRKYTRRKKKATRKPAVR